MPVPPADQPAATTQAAAPTGQAGPAAPTGQAEPAAPTGQAGPAAPTGEEAGLTREEAGDRAALVYDVAVELTLDLRPDDHAGVIARLTFGCRRPGAATFADAAFEVLRATVNGRPVEAAGGRLPLPDLAPTNVVEVTGRIAHRRDGAGLHRFVDPLDGRPYLHTKFQPFDAHRVFPCFDQPDLKGPVSLTVHAPADWTVVANGVATSVEPSPEGGRTHRFAPTEPLPPYLVAVVAGPYVSVRRPVDGLDVGLHVRPALADHLDVDELVELTAVGRRYYEALFGIPLPFGTTYDIAFVPEYGFGAMEHPGCITAHERFVFRSAPTAEQRRRRSEVLLHEMAHMWFGNLVTLRWWDDLWLNESFATLLAALAQSEATATGADTWAVFAADAKVRARDADRLPTTHPVQASVPDTAAVRSAFDAITYRKGAALLRQRLHETGRKRFLTGLSAYLTTFAHGTAAAADLHAALGPAGDRPGDRWATDWLCTTGAPRLAVGDGGDHWELALVDPPTPDLPAVAVTAARLASTDGATSELLTIEVSPGAPVRLDRRPGDLALVPNAEDGLYATVSFDAPTLCALADAVGRVRDPVLRAVVWGALWEAVIDGHLAADRYVEAVVAHAVAEPVPGVRQVVVERAVEAAWDAAGAGAATATGDGGVAGDRASGSARARLAAHAVVALDEQPFGCDTHRLLASALAATARSAEERRALASVERAYSGDGHVDLRWELLAGRARAGDDVAPAIAALEAADGGDRGRRGALRARAARPTAAAKAEAWIRATRGEGSLAERQAVLDGWAASGQDELRRPWEAAVLAVLPRLQQQAGVESALALARTGFPRWPADPDAVVAAARRSARSPAVAAPVQRALQEQVALLERRRRLRQRSEEHHLGGSTG